MLVETLKNTLLQTPNTTLGLILMRNTGETIFSSLQANQW